MANPYMKHWMSYMKCFNDKPDSQKTTPLKTVQHYYANGDDTVFPEVIAVGKQDIQTKQKAELLEWLHQKRHPELVLEQLMVNHKNTNVLSVIKSSHWIDYLEWYNIDHPESQTTLFNTLGHFYQGVRWDDMIRAGKKNRDTEKLATQLQMLHEKKDPEEVRKEIERGNVVANFLGHDNWLTWYKYLIYFNKVHPEREKSLRDTLGAYCKDGKLVDELSRKIEGLKNVPPITDAELKELKPEVDPEKDFKEKKLDEALDFDKARYQILKTTQLLGLMKYVKLYEQEVPDFKKSLRGIFPDEDQVLVDILYNQAPYPRLRPAMRQVLNDLNEDWLGKKMSPTDVFKILVKEIVDTSSFSSTRFHEWLRYFMAFDSKFKEEKVSIMSALNSKSGEKLLELIGSVKCKVLKNN
ncbi:unnamed protein product [Peronospora belbahrii]|uniref:RXLR phytopathogen effector protein WY-domain domain-containing protein n=1 Tax=Peronospora belbahrii TaxID=622444 RepID=A0AAU9KLM6_9STRA|nr:unnamed protein product [Peronospora belbahrii]